MSLKELFVSILVSEVLIVNCRMKWALVILLVIRVCGALVRKSVIFEKVKYISLIQGKWTAITTISLKPYCNILDLLQTELETVKKVLLQSIRNESEILLANLTNHTVPLFRLYQMRERFSVEISNYKLNRKYLEQEIREIRLMQSRRTRAMIPIVGKVLSFLFGTLDETDLDTIKTNVRHLANNQQQIKYVLTESMTFIKDNQQNINENRRTINSIITSLNASMTEQLLLNKQMHDMQRFNDEFTFVLTEP